MNALVVIGGLTLIYLIVALVLTKRSHDKADKWYKSLQTIGAVGAFGIAAFWYFIERKAQPHADVTQELHAVQVSPGLAAVEAHVSLKNLGSQLLIVKHARITLQAAEPGKYDYEALSKKKGKAYWQALKSRPRRPSNQFFHEAEMRWFPLREFNDAINHRIEPEETDLLVATFLVRCSIKTVRVATQITREEDLLTDQMTWNARSFLDLRSVCRDEAEKAAEAKDGDKSKGSKK